jgi:hypothetical protein
MPVESRIVLSISRLIWRMTRVRAKSLFATLNLPQDPDGLRVSDQGGNEVFFSDPTAGDR